VELGGTRQLHRVRIHTRLASDEKLSALRSVDPNHAWKSLDDRCTCILCEYTFSGRQVELLVSSHGRVQATCPTEGCISSPNEWVLPGNPLVSQKAWRDWERVLGGKRLPRKTLIKNQIFATS
jgi:hypothetical protein